MLGYQGSKQEDYWISLNSLHVEYVCLSRESLTDPRRSVNRWAVQFTAWSVVSHVLCAMQTTAQQRELLRYLLHSPLVHTLPEDLLGEGVFLLLGDA